MLARSSSVFFAKKPAYTMFLLARNIPEHEAGPRIHLDQTL